MSKQLDCRNVDNLVEKRGTQTWEKFRLVFHLTIMQLQCLQKIKSSKDRSSYPKEEEGKMMGKIKRGLTDLKPDLILRDPENLKYAGTVFQDYDVDQELGFKKFLIETLLESYKSIGFTFLKKVNIPKKKNRKRPEPKWKKEWKDILEDVGRDREIRPYFSPKDINTKEPFNLDPKAENYWNLRRDVESLYTVVSKFDELVQTSSESVNNRELNLALQRAFHVAGEYLKSTDSTPNLSESTAKDLMVEGVPVTALGDFRDLLAHYQLFPAFDLTKTEVENMINDGLVPIKKLMENEIANLEVKYIKGIVQEKLPNFENNADLSSSLTEFLKNDNVVELREQLLKHMKKSTNKDVTELFQNIEHMRSKNRLPDSEGMPYRRNIGNKVTGFIINSKLAMYDKLRGEVLKWKKKQPRTKFEHDLNRGIDEALSSHERLKSLLEVVDNIRYGGSPLPEDKYEELFHASELDDIPLEDSTVRKELDKYFDSKAFSDGVDYKKPENVPFEEIENLFSKYNKSPEIDKLFNFVKSLYGRGSTTLDSAEQYTKLVEKLKVNKTIKDKLLSFPLVIDDERRVSWDALPGDTKLEDFVSTLESIKQRSSERSKLIDLFKSLIENTPLKVNEYERTVEQNFDGIDAEKLLSFSMRWRKTKCGDLLKKYCTTDLKKIYDSVTHGKMSLIPEEYTKYVGAIEPEVEELYSRRLKEEVGVLEEIVDPNAVVSEFINIYSLVDNAQLKKTENSAESVGRSAENVGRSGESVGRSGESVGRSGESVGHSAENTQITSGEMEVVERKDELKKFRNFLSHGDALASRDEHDELTRELVDMKNSVVKDLKDAVESNEGKVNFQEIENIIDKVDNVKSGIHKIKNILCPESSRTLREIMSCLMKEDLEEVVESMEADELKVDSEKLLDVMSRQTDEGKFFNYVELAGQSEVEGEFKNEVGELVAHHNEFNGHLENVEKFSGYVMYAMMAKDGVKDILKGDYVGLAKDVGFFGGGALASFVSNIMKIKGKAFVEEGSRIALGRSLKLASPFLARGVSAFVAYDLWNQVKALKAGDKDAVVGVVSDSIQLGVDTVELGVEIGEGLSLIEGVSAVTGPIGMFVGAVLFVGANIYESVKAVEKIDKKIHLTGWEKFVQGIRSVVTGPSLYLQNLIEEKDGNNAAVQKALNILKQNPHILRYVFPSYVHVDGKLVSALDSLVMLTNEADNVKWARSRPDDVDGLNIFCKPDGTWEKAPASGIYYCLNAIGIEYPHDRTGDYTMINLGEGEDVAYGFLDSGNIFIIEQTKSLVGGNKDDTFIFHMGNGLTEPIHGTINGRKGIDTVDVGSIPVSSEFEVLTNKMEMVADFPSEKLEYSDKLSYNMYNINHYKGIHGGRDRVVADCDTLFVDTRGGGAGKAAQDSITIPEDTNCKYNMTIVITENTLVENNAHAGDFRYYAGGQKGSEAKFNFESDPLVRNTVICKYTLKDIAAIDTSEDDRVKFSFVDDFYYSFVTLNSENSANMTVSGHIRNTTYLLIDNTRLIIGENNIYALQNTDQPIDEIVEEFSNVMGMLNCIGVVHSNNEVLTVAGPNNDVMTNDPLASVSHFVSGAGENIFSFISGHDKISKDRLPISPVVVHYSDKVNSIDTFDLRQINEQIKRDLGENMEVNIVDTPTDMALWFYINDGQERTSVMEIKLKDVLDRKWFSKINLRYIPQAVFTIEESGEGYRVVPKPLVFDNVDDKLYVITPEDVVEGMEIQVVKELGSYVFARQEDDLVITNSLTTEAHKLPLATVILQFFYTAYRGKMQSLKIRFKDEIFVLGDENKKIEDAQNFQELALQVRISSFKNMVESLKRKRELFEAIDNYSNNLAKKILDDSYDIIRSKDVFMNPLVYSSRKGNLEMVQYLLNNGADVLAKDKSGHSALYYAVHNGNLAITDLLLREMLSIGHRGMIALTAELDVLKYLVEVKGLSYIKGNSNPGTATLLHYAVASCNGQMEVVKYLMEKDPEGKISSVDKNGRTPFFYAVSFNHVHVIDYFGDIIRKSGSTPLCFAAQIGELDVVRYLVEEKEASLYETSELHGSPLGCALGNMDVFSYLLELVNKEHSSTPLIYSAITNDLRLMKHFLETGMSYLSANSQGRTALHYAVIQSNLDMVKLLMDKHPDIYAKDFSGHTPLYYALLNPKCQKGNVEDLLGVVPKITSELLRYQGLDVVEFAARKGDLYILRSNKLEILRGIAANKRKSLLYYAIPSKDVEVVRYLVGLGVSTNEEEVLSGMRPLHIAAIYGQLEIVKFLIEHGADCTVVDKFGNTLLIYSKNEEVSNYLRDCVRKRGKRYIRTDQSRNHVLETAGNSSGTTSAVGAPNSIISWVKNSVSGLLFHKSGNESQNTPLIDSRIDGNATILLLDVAIRKITGQKLSSSAVRNESPLETQAYALNVVDLFEEVLNTTAEELRLPTSDLNFDPLAVQSAVIKLRRYGKTCEIPKMLYSFATKACPSTRPTAVFLEHFKLNLERILSQKDSLLMPTLYQVSEPLYSNKYGMVIRAVQSNQNQNFDLVNGDLHVLKLGT